MERKSFTPKATLKRFISYVVEDLTTAGQGYERKSYYELKDGYLLSIYVRARDRTREPAAEWMFIFMTIMFFTIIFQCILIELRPTLDAEIFLKVFYNAVNLTLATVSIALLILCIKRADD